jgi:hypothetical protein
VDTSGQEPLERDVITGRRQWTAAEVRAREELIFPAGLDRLMDLLSNGRPAPPVRLAWRG